ncbi:MAG: DUF4173 domain-containing protein, partial [Actinomycetota bacterium]|nr:DUF4173 domain-containing protein [Actinomycetota bacterium]
ERTRLGLGVLGGALAIGVLGDVLLRDTPWGINFLIWVTAIVGIAVLLARWGRVGTGGEGKWFILVAVVFAAGVVLRDSPTVVFLDVVGVLISLSLAVWRGRSGSLRRAGIWDYVLGGIFTGVLTSAGPLPVSVADIEWRAALRGRWKGQALAVSRGVLLAAPLLLLFGALLVAADAIFERLVIDIFGFDLAQVFSHLFLICSFAWMTAGLLWAGLMAHVPENLAIPRPRVVSLGIVEIGVVLGLLDLMFLTFVVIQIRYLFGGAGRVEATAGLTYAEYARHGFFELVTVTALALPLLLIAHWLLRAENRAHERLFKALAGIMVGLLFVIVASALQRMYLYQQAFGLTELRLYATIFMAWISTVLFWFVLTVMRGRRERFAFGALLAGFAAIFAINAMNPDALIATTNIERMEEGKRFDAYYLTTLSADAVPVLVESLPEIGDKRVWQDYTLEQALVYRWDKRSPDWRTWNLSRWRARQAVKSHVANQAGRAPRIASTASQHQDRAFMHRSDGVIHNMLWIRSQRWGISGSTVTSG